MSSSLDTLVERVAQLESRLAALDAHCHRLADESAILQLVATYGPAVDSGQADRVARLWSIDGVYDVDTGALYGRDAISEMIDGTDHQGLIDHGCAHLPGLPQIVLHGDRATVTGHSLLVVRSSRPGRYSVVRATANRWELRRIGAIDSPHRGWQVQRRTARLLTEDGTGREILGRADE